jgi:prepilin-type N-terminal cleavage/methylation domain-containing protein
MLSPDAAPGRGDAGFTLVELLITIVLLGIVMAAITAAMLGSIDASRAAEVRHTEARELRLATSYFATDAAGAQSFVTSGTARCGTGPVLVELRGEAFDAALARQVVIATYVLRDETVDGAPSRALHRLTCSSSAASPSYPLTPTADTAVARRLSTTGDPTVTCKDSSGGTVACSAAGAVTVVVGVTSRSGELTANLTGHRRTT